MSVVTGGIGTILDTVPCGDNDDTARGINIYCRSCGLRNIYTTGCGGTIATGMPWSILKRCSSSCPFGSVRVRVVTGWIGVTFGTVGEFGGW